MDWPAVAYLRRRVPQRYAASIVGYYHRGRRVFVIGRWISRAGGIINEMAVARHPAGFTRADIRDILIMLQPRRHRAYRTWAMEQYHRDKAILRKLGEQQLYQSDYRRYLQRRLPGVLRDDPNALLGLTMPLPEDLF